MPATSYGKFVYLEYKMIIYQLINNVNKKVYIGQTKFEIKKRFAEHIKASKKKNLPLFIHRAIKKYGPKNFSCHKLFECKSQKELDKKEIEFMELYNSLTPYGYNMILKASGGDMFTDHPNKEKIRKRISEGTKRGIAKSKKSWSKSHLGPKNGMHGRKHSKESIEKMKQNRRGKCLGDDNPMRRPGASEYIKRDKNGKFKTKNEDSEESPFLINR